MVILLFNFVVLFGFIGIILNSVIREYGFIKFKFLCNGNLRKYYYIIGFDMCLMIEIYF